MDAKDWDQRYAATELIWSAGPNQFVVSETSGLTPGTAFDMACGEGRNAIWLAQQGWRATGADFSAVAVEKARTIAEREVGAGKHPVTWLQADATVTGPAAGSFDLVLLAYLQLPAPDRAAAVRLAAAGLAPGGHLLVIAHDSSNLAEGVGGPQYPEVLYTAEDVLSDLSDTIAAGQLKTLRAERVARTVLVDGAPRTAWDALVHLAAHRDTAD
ncbi:class I SAM-dependent methyltransferase [soil metagenome]